MKFKHVLKTYKIHLKVTLNKIKRGHFYRDIQSALLSKMDTFGTGTKCPSYRESKKKGEKKGGDQLSVRLIEVSIKRESTVIQRKCSYQWNPLRLAYSTTLT